MLSRLEWNSTYKSNSSLISYQRGVSFIVRLLYVSIYRFLPPGSYLDGRQLGPKETARMMSEIINNKTMYYDFFRWRNHYVYKETSSQEDICKLCEMLNDEEKVNQSSVWKELRVWWNGARYKENC